MKNTKLTAAASFEGLCDRFEVYATGTDKLAAAIEDGTVDSILQECADVMYGGDMKPVRVQFGRVISSQKCNANKRGLNSLLDVRRQGAIDLLEAYHKKAIGTNGASKAPRAGFQYTIEEVDALAAEGNVAELQRLYNNVHSNVNKRLGGEHPSNWPTRFAEDPVLARWVKVKEYVSEVLPKVKKLAKTSKPVEETPNKPEVSDNLAKKLANYRAGKKATFTPEQMAEILKLLQG